MAHLDSPGTGYMQKDIVNLFPQNIIKSDSPKFVTQAIDNSNL